MTSKLQLGITKRYPAVVANSEVSLTVQPGESPCCVWVKTAPANRR
jgi:ABC-type uncharacterized transport system ATPase subunit